jgi:hypothetical protein
MDKMKLIEILVSLLSEDNSNDEAGGVHHPKGGSESGSLCNELIGKPVIVRCRDAGVHFGYLASQKDRNVTLRSSRRMWRWWAATQMSLSAVAEFGLNLEKDLRINNELGFIALLDACEVIPCSQECVDSFAKVEPYNEQD